MLILVFQSQLHYFVKKTAALTQTVARFWDLDNKAEIVYPRRLA